MAINQSINGDALLSISQASEILGYSIVWTRLLARTNRLPSYRWSKSGHRRFKLSDLKAFKGEHKEEEKTNTPIALVARVSSRQQSKVANGSKATGSSLAHQIERVETFCKERFGSLDNVTTYYGVGSGLNFDRPELLKLIDDIVSGKLKDGYIIATDFSRICRFGVRMIENLCKTHNVQILYSHPLEETTENESLVNEVLAVLCHFTAKSSGAKARAILKVRMDAETIKRCLIWTKQGFSYRWQEKELAKLGIKDESGTKRLTQHVIRTNVLESKEVMDIFNDSPAKGTFGEFLAKFVRRTGNNENKLDHKTLKNRYLKWCAENACDAFSDRKVYEHITSAGIEGTFNAKKSRVWLGVSMA